MAATSTSPAQWLATAMWVTWMLPRQPNGVPRYRRLVSWRRSLFCCCRWTVVKCAVFEHRSIVQWLRGYAVLILDFLVRAWVRERLEIAWICYVMRARPCWSSVIGAASSGAICSIVWKSREYTSSILSDVRWKNTLRNKCTRWDVDLTLSHSASITKPRGSYIKQENFTGRSYSLSKSLTNVSNTLGSFHSLVRTRNM